MVGVTSQSPSRPLVSLFCSRASSRRQCGKFPWPQSGPGGSCYQSRRRALAWESNLSWVLAKPAWIILYALYYQWVNGIVERNLQRNFKTFGDDTTKFHDSLDYKLTSSQNPAKSFLFGETFRMVGFGSQEESERVAIARKYQKCQKLSESWVQLGPWQHPVWRTKVLL